VIDWGNDLVTLHSDVGEAAQMVDVQISKIKEKLECDTLLVALTCHDTGNWRKEVYPPYKETRNEKRKPLVWRHMRDHLVNKYNAVIKPNLEADDVLGIWSTKLGPIAPGLPAATERIIVSIDKDFRTIPGKFFRLNVGNRDEYGTMYEISEEEADYNFYLQTLTGDSTDNYPGCAGIGPKRAATILTDRGDLSMWEAVVNAYKKAGFGEEFALTQARCARILRASDYDFKNKKPILWSPPCE
jgi:DNA polymerase-1